MARRRQKIWITRAQPGAAVTAERVRALGHEAVVAPLLAVQPLADVQVDLVGVAALAFTSANGVRAFADLSAERALRVFAVGAATAEAARAAGFKLVLSADGDVEALAAGIGQRRGELRGAVLHPGALEPAGDLVRALEAQGVTARRLVLYETLPVTLAPEAAAQLVASDAVLLHSPRAAQVLAALLKAHPAPALRALGLSKAVVRPLARAKVGPRVFPSMPLEGALLNLIDRTP
ncbi:uroporphyrinogen-III synthase [Phenylobacterium sp.]|uniref:uroporphyrinogen-III synthase n=1 Tax=Phenylobacterium sp. TaxID=1871053 RepID=UPI001227D7E5|nr:uroporphyrinogen-III synthase [Phenylobacterium sp.]THD58280.1 MAG: uroporphyrinogen-III synthase [Phenylobacterium sp.]